LHLHWLLAILCVSPLAFFDVTIEVEKKESYANEQKIVTNAEELLIELDNASWWEIILLQAWNYWDISISPKWLKKSNGVYDSEVILRSLDTNNMAQMGIVSILGAENITFDSIKFIFDPNNTEGSSTRLKYFSVGAWSPTNRISQNISVINSMFIGLDVDSDNGWDPLNHLDVLAHDGNVIGLPTGIAVYIRSIDWLLFENNEITWFHRWAIFNRGNNMVIRNNYVHNVRSDWFDFAAVKDVVIEKNEIRDTNQWRHELASGKWDHADLIQFWTANTEIPSENIIIRWNLLHVSTWKASQSIFMRNEVVDRGQAGDEMLYRNILIENNIIYNAHAHGTTVWEWDNITIRNNTYIQNLDQWSDTVNIPAISVADSSTNVVIENNIVPKLKNSDKVGSPGWEIKNNLITQTSSPQWKNYVWDIFIDVQSGRYSNGSDLKIHPNTIIDTQWKGSKYSIFEKQPAKLEAVFTTKSSEFSWNDFLFSFDASLTADEDGFLWDSWDYFWDFWDGSKAQWRVVNYEYASPGEYQVHLRVVSDDGSKVSDNINIVKIKEPILIELEINKDSIQDISTYNTPIESENINGLIRLLDNKDYVYDLSKNINFEFERDAVHMYNHDQFSFHISLQRDTLSQWWGYIFNWTSSMYLIMDDEWFLKFGFSNIDEESFELVSDVAINNTHWNDIILSYDSNSEKAKIYINGNLTWESNMSGLSDTKESWGLQLGYVFKNNFEWVIRNFKMLNIEYDDTQENLPFDTDLDTIPDDIDNCPLQSNITQLNTDGDAVGNACDPDDDNDGINDDEENSGCLLDPDLDCGVITLPSDLDQDTIPDSIDNCISIRNVSQTDFDGDRIWDACDKDEDNDTILDIDEHEWCKQNTDINCWVEEEVEEEWKMEEEEIMEEIQEEIIQEQTPSESEETLEETVLLIEEEWEEETQNNTSEETWEKTWEETSEEENAVSPIVPSPVVSTSSSSSSWSGGWGWWSTSSRKKDSCSDGDRSWSLYDNSCGSQVAQTQQEETQRDDTMLEDVLPEDEIFNLLSAGEEIEREILEQKLSTTDTTPENTSYVREDNTTVGDIQSSSSSQARKGLREITRNVNASSSQVEYRQEREYIDICSTASDVQKYIYTLDSPTDYIFTDEWYSDKRLKIRKFHALDIINGYEDGSFRPEQGVTRTEFLKILLKTHCHDYNNERVTSLKYIDVDVNSWQARVIQRSEKLWLINGDTDTEWNPRFRPNDVITKLEAIKIILNMSEIQVDQRLRTNYNDVRIPWHRKYVETAETLWLYDAYLEWQVFDANVEVQRDDMIDLIDRTIGLYK